jgi:hypothetical protein
LQSAVVVHGSSQSWMPVSGSLTHDNPAQQPPAPITPQGLSAMPQPGPPLVVPPLLLLLPPEVVPDPLVAPEVLPVDVTVPLVLVVEYLQ